MGARQSRTGTMPPRGIAAYPRTAWRLEGDDSRCWDPRAPPCVPSDYRSAHLFGSLAAGAAKAVGKAARVEMFMKPTLGYNSWDFH